MLFESLFLGGLALLSVLAVTPRLLSPIALGERVTDFKAFTIRLKAVGPEVTITGYSAPSELNPGEIPTVTVSVRHNRTQYEWIFARIRDLETNEVICPMKRQYVLEEKEFSFTFSSLAPYGDWGSVMPSRDWNLQLEVGLWWV